MYAYYNFLYNINDKESHTNIVDEHVKLFQKVSCGRGFFSSEDTKAEFFLDTISERGGVYSIS